MIEFLVAVASALVVPAALVLGFLVFMAIVITGLARSDQYV